VHELSIAMSLVDTACEELSRLGDVRVDALHLRLGPLSGVVKDALLFCFDVAAKGTPIEGARLDVEDVPVAVFCPTCEVERTVEALQYFQCPVCGTIGPRLVRGRELELTAMEVTDNEPADRRGPEERPQEE
jgi:hydrogenase nickel incorporation protein HypA/HybF